MRFLFKYVGLSMLAAIVGLAPISSKATTVTYVAQDLVDTTPGEDLWRYIYTITGNFGTSEGVNLLFDAALYGDLSNAQPDSSVNPNWNVTFLSPDPLLPADGVYSVASLIPPPPDLTGPFGIDFVWRGSDVPGSQPFEVFNSDFIVIDEGRTQPPGVVSEPAGLVLFALSIVGLIVQRRRGDLA